VCEHAEAEPHEPGSRRGEQAQVLEAAAREDDRARLRGLRARRGRRRRDRFVEGGLWYVLPVVAVFHWSWKVGVVLFVVYSAIRAGIAVVLSGVGETRSQSAHRLQDRLVSLKPLMRTACAGALVVVS
jgi:hypothetical protein